MKIICVIFEKLLMYSVRKFYRPNFSLVFFFFFPVTNGIPLKIIVMGLIWEL